MKSRRTTSGYEVPSFAKREAYNFVQDKESLEIYRELNQIAEEIEECRRKKL